MPMSGGPSDKTGNTYEELWTIMQLIEIMHERADRIRIEPPGDEGKGVEFWLNVDDKKQYHQAKRQYGTRGCWSIADLDRRGVLNQIWEKLADPKNEFVFVSMDAAFQLREISERVKKSNSCQEFEEKFLSAAPILTAFNDLCRRWGNCTKSEAYIALQRVNIVTVEEGYLKKSIDALLDALVDGPPDTIREVLGGLVSDNIHQELRACDIWQHLETQGFSRRRFDKDPHTLSAMKNAIHRYCVPIRNGGIKGSTIPRVEANRILEILTAPETKHCCVIGGAGVGKSNVMLQVVDALNNQGIPLFVFRVDRLEQTQLPEKVGEQLGLPSSPANVLSSVAQGEDCVLIIDQLDAVSLTSGRTPMLFDCINEIIEQTKLHPQMRLLLACRRFDLENDNRLRKLTNQPDRMEMVEVTTFSESQVKDIVKEIGVDGNRLNSNQISLLTIPLHLGLFSEIVESNRLDHWNFNAVKDLYELFWARKQDTLTAHHGRPVQLSNVLYTLSDYMSKHSTLTAPSVIVDQCGSDVSIMVSERILIREGDFLSFFHEGFFDYVFARAFIARDGDLLSLLKNQGQHLFCRAQVRQILLHKRDVSTRSQYISDLNTLLNSDIRSHLKQAIFSFLSEVPDPSEEEWGIIAPFIDSSNTLFRQNVWQIIQNIPWWELLNSLGVVEEWMNSQDDELVDRAVRMSIRAQRGGFADRVAELVEPHIGETERWDKRIMYLYRLGNLSEGGLFFKVFLRLLDEDFFDNNERNEPREVIQIERGFWGTIYSLPKKRPELAAIAIRHYFDQRLELSLSRGQSNPFREGIISRNQMSKDAITRTAKSAPEIFVEQIFPFMRRVIELNTFNEDGRLKDPNWSYRSYGGGGSIEGVILSSMEHAFCSIAKEKDSFEPLANQIRDSNYETLQYLLIRAYTSNGEEYANEAIDLICNQTALFRTGWTLTGEGDATYWATRELIEATTPHCSDERLETLQETILDYTSNDEEEYANLVLLEGIDPPRRSEAAMTRIEELQTEIPAGQLEPPKQPRSVATLVESPIPLPEAEAMTDDEWRENLSFYNGEEQRHLLTGSVHQLSGVLEGQVQREPNRFFELALTLPETTHPQYFRAILRGERDSGLDPEKILALCEYCHELPNRPCGSDIAKTISHLPESSLRERALEVISWYATEYADKTEELWRERSENGALYHQGDPMQAGINSVRGAAAQEIATIILKDKTYLSYFHPILEKMVCDPSIAVRTCVAFPLIALLKHDRELAIKLFYQLCDTEDVLLKSDPIERFISYSAQTHYGALQTIFQRMLTSEDSDVVKVGARQICLASLNVEAARPLAISCVSGDDISKKYGAAQVFAANLSNPSYRDFCESNLLQLFESDDDEVAHEASLCFRSLGEEDLGEYENIILSFVQNVSSPQHYYSLTRAFEKSPHPIPNTIIHVCKHYLDLAGSDSANIATELSPIADSLCELIVRKYGQTKEPAIQTQCLDLIDRMTEIGIYGLPEALESYRR